ncbi:aminoglycoside phosphotransferase family protein [Kribbella sp. NBC_01484]|uniref:aminoglycoside phosphotransferase family protein n=1 Tax=Kribbella sp. NBC_01484 TaxID=2903579 RepID=UPI002E359E52|nr:aminoglycoside phosphotransferase family protein [Kribbella sp. NBC_01484]
MTETAVQAAATAARDLGLTVTDPTVLYDAFSVVVHLKPSPVVARVPMNLPDYLTDVEVAERRQQRELDLAAWLLSNGHPVVAPSPLVPLKPVERDGFSMTFWQYVEQSGQVDYLAATTRAAELHAVLADYPEELPWLTPLLAVPSGLATLEAVPGLLEQEDVDRARAEWEVLRPVLTSRAGFEAVFPAATIQTIHGDAPAYNVIPTTGGMVWADFEDATLGPIEWDMAGFGPDLGKVYDEAAAALGRPQLDERVQQVMDTARVLQIAVCTPLVQQMPALADGIRMFVGQWRAMPFAGGLG